MHAKFCFRKMFVCVRKSICDWKKNQKNFWAKFSKLLEKFFVSPSKKCQSYNFHIWELYDKHFFQKRKTSVFYHQIVLLESYSHRNEFIPVLVSTIFRNCMKIVWQAFSLRLVVWNCMISIFGVWRSTREATHNPLTSPALILLFLFCRERFRQLYNG